jgi:hypothetical protein
VKVEVAVEELVVGACVVDWHVSRTEARSDQESDACALSLGASEMGELESIRRKR